MGTWGYGIFDNDEALEWLENFAEIASTVFEPEYGSNFDQYKHYKNQFFTLVNEKSDNNRQILYLILGFFALPKVSILTRNEKDLIFEAIQQQKKIVESGEEDWDYPEKRIKVLNSFERLLKENYSQKEQDILLMKFNKPYYQ